MKNQKKFKVTTRLFEGKPFTCYHDTYELAKRDASMQARVWTNFKSVEIIKE